MLTNAAVAVTLLAPVIPQDFLLFEKAAKGPRKEWQSWQVSGDVRRPLLVNPCWRKRADEAARVAARTVGFTDEVYGKAEQLVVYRDAGQARQAMNRLRADLKKCADIGKGHNRALNFSKPLKLGDEALRSGSRYFEGGQVAVVARKGAVVFLYAETAVPTRRLPAKQFKNVLRWANQMAGKVCALPQAGC
ncbi:hypothetical protein [Thermoactinospora rubra]|uniref:hypothetical protein n=1 Tax=Thermoactinospora rubra TaxID=1088767 RepID=UPI000A11DCF9|nr:hypothetical protein [Thermoactinospora rubra]